MFLSHQLVPGKDLGLLASCPSRLRAWAPWDFDREISETLPLVKETPGLPRPSSWCLTLSGPRAVLPWKHMTSREGAEEWSSRLPLLPSQGPGNMWKRELRGERHRTSFFLQEPAARAASRAAAQLGSQKSPIYLGMKFAIIVLSCSVASDSLLPHGLKPARLLCPGDLPGKNTGVSCHALLHGIFPTQGSNPHLLRLLHCRQILHCWATGEAPEHGINSSQFLN